MNLLLSINGIVVTLVKKIKSHLGIIVIGRIKKGSVVPM